MREYLQHLLLSFLYQHPQSDKLAFKGGTALKLLYRSPRFSEDLDFSTNVSAYQIKKILEEISQNLTKEAIPFTCLDSKETSGGYLALYQFTLYSHPINIEWNLSLRHPVKPEPILVTSPMIPHYQCMTLPIKELSKEKMSALLRRKKPRDFFDLYFLLRERRGLESIIPLKKQLIREVGFLEPKRLKEELKLFLPISHHSLLNHFSKALITELERL